MGSISVGIKSIINQPMECTNKDCSEECYHVILHEKVDRVCDSLGNKNGEGCPKCEKVKENHNANKK